MLRPKFGMKRPQVSRYNYFVERSEGVVTYNARTGVFALLTPDVASALLGHSSLDGIRDKQGLAGMGFLHYGDELEQIAKRFKEQRELDYPLHITLVPTLACNLKCPYCFQNDYRDNQVMPDSIQEAALDCISRWIAEGRTEVLITWFGGEPLLCKEIVVDMSAKLQDIAAEADANLELTVVTNGTLLNKSVARALSDVGIASAQITFDALRYESPGRRGVLDSDNQLSPIMHNACASRQYMRIGIRVNVSTENRDDIPHIIEVLRAHDFGSDITLARVYDCRGEETILTKDLYTYEISSSPTQTPAPASSALAGGHGLSLTRSAYARLERDVYLSGFEGLKFVAKKLRPRGQFCSATTEYMFVIDPAGYISRCWHSAGSPAEALGKVDDEDIVLANSPVTQILKKYTPLSYPSCLACKVLPLCMGGCPHARLFMKAQKPPCEAIKQQVEFCVRQVATHLEITDEQLALVKK